MRQVKDHRGNVFSSKKEMCQYYDISQSLFAHRIRRGYTLKESLEGKDKVRDHEGNVFSSVKEMCDFYGISVRLYNARVKRGINGEKLFSQERLEKHSKTQFKDHFGNSFNSLTKMCEYYNINRNTFLQRIDKGMSVKDALTSPVDEKVGNRKRGTIDYKGIEYTTKKEMCEAYGVKYRTFMGRIQMGWTLEEALTNPLGKSK